MKHPTVPREPNFHIPQHKKIKCCLSWDDISSYAYQLWSTRKKKPEIIIMLLSPITEWSFFLAGGISFWCFLLKFGYEATNLVARWGNMTMRNHQSADCKLKEILKVGKSNKRKTLYYDKVNFFILTFQFKLDVPIYCC